MAYRANKSVFLNFMLAVITSAIWIKYKNLSIADSIICFLVVFFVLFTIDTFSNWVIYRNTKRMKKEEAKKSGKNKK